MIRSSMSTSSTGTLESSPRFLTTTERASCTTLPMCVGHCSRKSSSSGGWTLTKWSPAAGAPTASIETLRRRWPFWTSWTSTPSGHLLKRWHVCLATRRITWRATSQRGSVSSPKCGPSLTNPTPVRAPR
ncbi:hypothetical protein ONE63_002496 [Megalurothrips usitatus]|uniref:Uncharacterized protein n=1 Tax=Megalurothrips usitatus TaxID=439358 RepID=A0AAV7XF19_9NEOP|nr:hypothetical protein ONE63_002496 [Megalurothrips usitatus]